MNIDDRQIMNFDIESSCVEFKLFKITLLGKEKAWKSKLLFQ